jgi:hypothetical protein
MDAQTLLSLVLRHALTTAAGALAAHGYLASSGSEQFISAGMLAAGILWSWWQKSGQALALAEAQRAYDDVAEKLSRAKRPPAPSIGPAAPTV